jgi:hypothetical protein
MVLFTNNRKLVGFKNPELFGTELELKNQGVILDEKFNCNNPMDHMMQKAFWQCRIGDRENMGTETKGCVLDIHFGGETHSTLP